MHLKTLSSALCLTLASLWFGPAHANEQPQYSKQYEDCMEAVDLGAMKNSQWMACAEQELKRVDADLNANYKKLQQALNTEQREALKKAQRAWLQYRKERCDFEYVAPTAPGGEANRSFCLLEMTAQKSQYLRQMHN